MKYGYRTPSIKKSVKAQTTARVKRNINKSVNPMYAKSGMGYINDPEKAIYNKIYNKTTRNILDEETRINIVAWIIVLIIAIPILWIVIKFFLWLF